MQFAVKLSIVPLCCFLCSYILYCNLLIWEGEKLVWLPESIKIPIAKQLFISVRISEILFAAL